MRRCGPAVCVLVVLLAGCATRPELQPEVFASDSGQITIEGWTEKDEFHVALELKTDDEATTLHSLQLVDRDGEKHAPTRWSDKTPKPPKVSVGIGLGFGGRGDHGHHAAERRSGGFGGVGLSFPLTGSGRGKKVTAVEACWRLTEGTEHLEKCTLEVNLASVRADKIEVTTFPLAMAPCRETREEEGEPSGEEIDLVPTAPPPEREESEEAEEGEDLIREIDFTLKRPPTKKVIAV